MIDSIKKLFASGRVVDDSADLQQRARQIKQGWFATGAPAPVIATMRVKASAGLGPPTPGGMVQITVGQGQTIQTTVQSLATSAGSVQTALQQAAYNAAIKNQIMQQNALLQNQLQNQLSATQMSGAWGGASGGGGGAGTSGYGGSGGNGGAGIGQYGPHVILTTSGLNPSASPYYRFGHDWYDEYLAELEAQRYARDVEET